MPTYAGDGRVCGLDSDSDGFPDEGLNCSQPFCSKVRMNSMNTANIITF